VVIEQRPFDILQKSIGKTVIVRLKGNTVMRGILKSFDPHLNLFLENAVLVKNSETDSEEQIGQVVLRGDNVLMVSPP
jgi:small nuclear ribonucleoprotein (snRNP)-like protein